MAHRRLLAVFGVILLLNKWSHAIGLPEGFPEFPAFPDLSDLFRPPPELPARRFRSEYEDEDSRTEEDDLSRLDISSLGQPSFRGSEEDEEAVRYEPPRKPSRYPQIFKFNKDRVNLADFDRRKKKSRLALSRDDGLDPSLIPRRKFLVLRGGTFKSWNY